MFDDQLLDLTTRGAFKGTVPRITAIFWVTGTLETFKVSYYNNLASGGDACFGATSASCQVIPAVLGSTLNSAEPVYQHVRTSLEQFRQSNVAV